MLPATLTMLLGHSGARRGVIWWTHEAKPVITESIFGRVMAADLVSYVFPPPPEKNLVDSPFCSGSSCWPGPMYPRATYLVSLLAAQEVAGHVLRQHVGDQGLVPASHFVDPLLLVVDLNFPQEERPRQFLHLG